VPDGEVERDLPAEAVAIEKEGPRAGGDEGGDLEEIVDEHHVIADIAATPLGAAMAAKVPSEDAEPGGIEAADDVGVTAQVLAHAVGEED